MNPAFVLLAVLALVALWFLASGIYKLIGKFILRIGSDAVNNMKDDSEG